MNLRIAMIASATVCASAVGSFWLDHRERSAASVNIKAWVDQHAHWRNDPNSPEPWRWRAPATEGRFTRWSNTDPRTVLLAGAGQEVWAVNEAAKVGTTNVPTEAIPLVSISTASFLGVSLPMEPNLFHMLSEGIVAGLDPWRTIMVQRCGSCAPYARAFPSPDEPVVTAEHGLAAQGVTGINIDVERRRRSAVPFNNTPSPMTAMVLGLRNGAIPTPVHWATPGLAGMAALELAAMQRTDLAPAFQALGSSGPSRTDKIAGLWAAHLMGATTPELETIKAAM